MYDKAGEYFVYKNIDIVNLADGAYRGPGVLITNCLLLPVTSLNVAESLNLPPASPTFNLDSPTTFKLFVTKKN